VTPTEQPFATARLAIEPLVPAHAAAFHAALDHPDVWQFINGPGVTTVLAQRARIERLSQGCPRPGERWWNFAVVLRADHTLIGHLQATTYGDWGEIAYMFGPRWWGHGLCSEATAWLLDHLAAHQIGELWAAVHPANARSQRLLIRNGFTAVDDPARSLSSFDPGDLVFVRQP
jgi:RimJ/RimL family protein N-acetyltransferase